MGALSRLSGQVARDNNDVRAGGAKVFFFNGGTTTPLTVYQDAGESSAHTQPVVADSNGRWPAIFIPFIVSYDEQVTTSSGTELSYYTEIPNPDPVDVAAGAVTTASTQLLQTGDVLFNPKSGTRTGFVRANGRTMGNAASGGTERANADTADLFTYLWNGFADSLCAVSTGRGATAAADFAANKTITLFDLRGTSIIGLDDMGNSAAGRLSAATFATGDAVTGGSTGGENTHTLSTAELASHGHGVGTYVNANESSHTHTAGVPSITAEATHRHTYEQPQTAVTVSTTSLNQSVWSNTTTSVFTSAGESHTHTLGAPSISAGSAHTHSISGSSATAGSGTAHNTVHRSLTGNWLIKL